MTGDPKKYRQKWGDRGDRQRKEANCRCIKKHVATGGNGGSIPLGTSVGLCRKISKGSPLEVGQLGIQNSHPFLAEHCPLCVEEDDPGALETQVLAVGSL